ncbi:hypothetical protein G9A89_011287 [Geosiphon pyriformis]|nr:hypothetical protein G9A89_011287 [Geosiphon pyriformis]
MISEFFGNLSRDFEQLLYDFESSNVILQVGDPPDSREFHAHLNILRARSPYFRSAFSADWINKKNNSILGLLVAADELLLDEVINYVQEHLIENRNKWLSENLIFVLHTIFPLHSCERLQEYCLEYICGDPRPFFESQKFPSLNKDILFTLLQRDDLGLEEDLIWVNLLRWACGQSSSLVSQKDILQQWSIEDFQTLGKILAPCLPFIRFFEISSSDYYDKVRPYEKALPTKLLDEIMAFHMKGLEPKLELPPRVGSIRLDSTILTSRHVALLASWIDQKDHRSALYKRSPYDFKLLYRASRDEFSVTQFHQKCNNKGAAVVVLKVQDSMKIIGGYNPIGWVSNIFGWRASPESFIFSLGTRIVHELPLLSRFRSMSGHAIFDADIVGPYFGRGDLYVHHPNLSTFSCKKHSYEHQIMESTRNYNVEEIEVFQVIRK